MAGCTDDLFDGDGLVGGKMPITLSGEINQVSVTRVNDNGFCDGDVMGVYIVDYDGNTPGTLQVSGNRGDNVRHTFDEANYKWNSAYDLYWKDKHTHIDVYGYYPFGSPESIDAYAFTVQRDQSTSSENGTMGGYEASDFLWGKAENVAPTTSVVRLSMSHRMANARVTLVEGTGFEAGEWVKTEKTVLVTNLCREATINLADGTVTQNGGIESTATIPSRVNDEWRAIVVPQSVAAGTTLFSITIGGVPYKFSKNENFTYMPGKMSNFSIRVDKKAGSGQYTLTLISESITAWENDLVSHDATSREYVIINSTAGHLKDAIIAANKDYTKLKNLKITGQINSQDFYFMRDSMEMLQALNLKEVRIKGGTTTGDSWVQGKDDEIPDHAFENKGMLTNFVFPDTLKEIGTSAFHLSGITGSLIIPEGVTIINGGAFEVCRSLTGTLSLPSTLKRIEGVNTFLMCPFVCELKLPESLEFGKISVPIAYCRTTHGGDITVNFALTEVSGMGSNPQLSFYSGSYEGGTEHYTSAILRDNQNDILIHTPEDNDAAPWLDETENAIPVTAGSPEQGIIGQGSFTVTAQELAATTNGQAEIELRMVITDGTQYMTIPYTIYITNQSN